VKDAVSVVVITYNDAAHLPDAIESALAQGEIVQEVVVVDDASTDDTPQVLGRWPRDRVRVVRRTVNSGGCGAPRNDGTAFARAPWIFYLDSDDVLPPGALEALLEAARAADADFAAGLCIRRELPERRDVPWQRGLFAEAGVHSLASRPETLWDTLSVNKLYRRSFLTENGIQFPDGAEHYEDFVFTAEVYATARRFAVTPKPVYTWNVRRRAAGAPSISLRRDTAKNWQDRVGAHARVLETMRATGDPSLVAAAERKFAEHDVPLYLRDLPLRDTEYQNQWWAATRAHLAGFDPESLASAPLPTRWAAAVIATRETPCSLPRLAELTADPPRLTPPYAGTSTRPLWDDESPAVPLVGLSRSAPGVLPVDIEASVALHGGRLTLNVDVMDLYGLVSAAGITDVDVLVRDRAERVERVRPVTMEPAPSGGILRGRVVLDGAALRGLDVFATWDLWGRVRFVDGSAVTVRIRATGGSGLRRHLVPDLRRAMLLVQPYRTSSHGLAIRVADGPRGAAAVAGARLRRQTSARKP